MRWLILAAAIAAGGCSKPKATPVPDAAPPAPTTVDLSPDAATATITLEGKPFAVASVAGVQTLRAGERDPKKAPIVLVTLQDPSRNTLTFDIPFREGAAGEMSDARVKYEKQGATYANPETAFVNVTRVDPDAAGYLYDANFDIPVKSTSGEVITVHGTFNRLRVRQPIRHLQKL